MTWASSELNTFMPQRVLFSDRKDNPQNGRKYFQIIYLIRVISRIYKELLQLNININKQLSLVMGKGLE